MSPRLMIYGLRVLAVLGALGLSAVDARAEQPLKVGLFAVDASPPIGSPLAYDPNKEVTVPLRCKGLVLE